MREQERVSLEVDLSRHYAAQRGLGERQAAASIARAMLDEDARMCRVVPCNRGAVAFVASQVRYIPAWTWAAQVALVALMCAVARAAGNAESTSLTVGILSAMTVLVAVPTVQASKQNGVAELEYACLHNAASVMVARLIVLGCSSALAVALMVAAAASAVNVSAFVIALWTCPPFFLSCAGSLMALRTAHPASASMRCLVCTSTCCLVLLVLAAALPGLYEGTSVAIWLLAAACALAWLIHELALTVRAASAGLDAFSPQLAHTYH